MDSVRACVAFEQSGDAAELTAGAADVETAEAVANGDSLAVGPVADEADALPAFDVAASLTGQVLDVPRIEVIVNAPAE